MALHSSTVNVVTCKRTSFFTYKRVFQSNDQNSPSTNEALGKLRLSTKMGCRESISGVLSLALAALRGNWRQRGLLRVDCIPLQPQFIMLMSSEWDLTGNRVLQRQSSQSEVTRVGPSPTWLGSFWKGEIWTQRQTHTQGRWCGETQGENTVYEPRREAWSGWFPHSPQEEPTLGTPWSRTSSLQTMRKWITDP